MLQDLFVNACILVTFISISQQIFKDKHLSYNSPVILKSITGLISAMLGIILMLFSLHIDYNTILDFRSIPIILTAIYGGLIPSFISGLLIGVFRICYFGLNQSSIAAFISALLQGIGCGIISYLKTSKKNHWIYSVIYCLLVVTISFSIVIKNPVVLMKIVLAYCTVIILVSMFVYKYTNYLSELTNIYWKLKEGYSKDFLTGLNNVRFFDTTFNKVLAEADEKNKRLSILFIDIDFFKKVNDTYGHANGDIVLKQLSYVLKNNCRSSDIVSRNGGEEFSVLLLECPSNLAMGIAEKIRKAVENYQFSLNDNRKINITISIGVATYPDTTTDLDKLFESADSALYKAKRSGRNKVVLAQ